MDVERSAWRERLSRREFIKLGTAGASIAFLNACTGGGGGGTGGETTLDALFMQQAAYSNTDVQGMIDAFTKANKSMTAKPTFVAYEALHDKIVTAAPAGTFDVVLIDVIWPPEFATKGEVVDVSGRFPSGWTSEIFSGALDTARYQDKFYGVPWILDTKYFFFNRDMLAKVGSNSPPETWDDAIRVASDLKSKNVVQYPFVWSWAQAEAVICDYAQLLGAFGGSFLDQDGKPTFNTGGGLAALEFMKKTIDEGLSNPASTESLEEDVRKTFSAGQAAMALNWTYMYALANDPQESQVAGSAGITPTPAGPSGARPGCNGSMALSVAAGSDHQDDAWKLVEFMTSQRVQDQYARLSLPIWKSSYDDPAVVKTAGADVIAAAKVQLNDMILRPQVPAYNEASQALQLSIQDALTGAKTPQQALDDAASKWEALLQS
jgi:multiple sugar transport system substrate-binding protein